MFFQQFYSISNCRLVLYDTDLVLKIPDFSSKNILKNSKTKNNPLFQKQKNMFPLKDFT